MIYTLLNVFGAVGQTPGSKINRVSGRVIENPLRSVTIDLFLKCLHNFSALALIENLDFVTHGAHTLSMVLTTRKSDEDSVALSWDPAYPDRTR